VSYKTLFETQSQTSGHSANRVSSYVLCVVSHRNVMLLLYIEQAVVLFLELQIKSRYLMIKMDCKLTLQQIAE